MDEELTFGVSGKVSQRRNDDASIDYLVGLSTMYKQSGLEVLFEALYGRSLEDATDFYLELSYLFADDFIALLRFDWLDILPRNTPGRNIRHHQEIILGLGHQLTSYWRTELTYHLLTGNRFARVESEEVGAVQDASQWPLSGHAVIFGVVLAY